MSILDKLTGGLGINPLAIIADVQRHGPAALAPLLERVAPNAVHVMAMQRACALALEQLSVLNKTCGDAVAMALANKGDVPDGHVYQLGLAFGNSLKLMLMLHHRHTAAARLNVGDLAEFYRAGMPE